MLDKSQDISITKKKQNAMTRLQRRDTMQTIPANLLSPLIKCTHLFGERVHGTMYGLLLESVQHHIQMRYGESLWLEVLNDASLAGMVFTTHKRYPDSIITNLAESCSKVIKDRDKEGFIEYFGKCFVEFCSQYGYDKILRVSGRHFRDFLHGIDNLHETMRFSYPRLQSPSFYVEKEDCYGCILHYRSRRIGFTGYVKGQIIQSAKKYYGLDVIIEILQNQQTDQGCHVIYRLNFDNSAFRKRSEEKKCSISSPYTTLSSEVFFRVFPFCIVFNSSLVITHIGPNLVRLFSYSELIGYNISTRFGLRRPRMDFTWEQVLRLQRVIFELESLIPLKTSNLGKNVSPDSQSTKRRESLSSNTLLLRGQMKYMADWNSVAFLCTPLLGDLEEMETKGLYINDLNMHDGSREMVLAGWQHASRLEYSIEKQVDKSTQIQDNLLKLDEWRKRGDTLLYSMIPKSIAIRLKNGEDPINTCEVFDEVTIMFSFLIGFNDICEKVSALDIIQCINSIITLFDNIVEKFDVFKVETLGDACYMVAGGVPDHNPRHAPNVASLALELVDQVKTITDPSGINESLNLKIGMHTGPVVAGIVGRCTPQYCLFGDTVNTSSRMQSYSQADRIHVSDPCNTCLDGSDFVTIFRGTINVKTNE
ncbi:unnamed protein product [Owenia fusiformis]|uniref:guanylate cyclase n=1 Tax=Owenia fusiformis TaxID=6347 RepID=A0A8J1V148_OWEFU|nr:unnamed protein product [Owenia fusiformis]